MDGVSAIVIGVALTALTVWLLIVSVPRSGWANPSFGWPSVPGRVTKSAITEGDDSRLEFEYRYKVDDVAYDGDVLHAGESTRSSIDNEELLERYAVGTEVEVHYDPNKPSTAVLIPAVVPRWANLVMATSMCLLLVGVILAADGIAIKAAESSIPEADSYQQSVTAAGNAPSGIVTHGGITYYCDLGLPVGSTATAPGLPRTTGRVLVLGDSRDLTSGALTAPVGMAIGQSGTIYITDHDPAGHAGRLWVFTLGGSGYQSVIVASGVKPLATLQSPGGVALDSAGNVYATEPTTGRVLRFAPRATTATEFFRSPDDGSANEVAIDRADNAYVSDSRNSRVWKVATHGDARPMQVPASFLVHPQGVAVDEKGNLYIVDSGNNRVLKFAPDLNSAIDVPFTGLNNPYGVAVTDTGVVYVTDKGNNRVVATSAP